MTPPRTSTAGAATADGTAGAVPFPSVAWFERLATRMREQRARHEQLGTIDAVARFTVLDGAPGEEPWHVVVTFEEFGVTSVREVADDEPCDPDFTVETDLETWEAMIRSITDGGGRPALGQTLNYLSLPGTPIRVWSEDPVRRDLFFRFNQTLQEFFNASASFPTVFPGGR